MTLGRGVPGVVQRDTMLVLPFRAPAAFELIREHASELAAVMVQPVQNNLPRLDMAPFLAGLRTACDAAGALLFFDEVVTGLRIGLRGAQGRFAVRPDLTAASMLFLAFQHEEMQSSRDVRRPDERVLDDFFLHMLARGVLMPGNRMVLLSTAHQAADVDAVADAIRESLGELRTDGLI